MKHQRAGGAHRLRRRGRPRALAHFLQRSGRGGVGPRRAIPRVLELLDSPSRRLGALLDALPLTGDLFTRQQDHRGAARRLEPPRVGSRRTAARRSTPPSVEESKLYLATLARLLRPARRWTHADVTGRATFAGARAAAPGAARAAARRARGRAREATSSPCSASLHDARDLDAARTAGITQATTPRQRAHSRGVPRQSPQPATARDASMRGRSTNDRCATSCATRGARYAIPVASRRSTLNELLAGGDPHDAEGSGLVLAALYAVHTGRRARALPDAFASSLDAPDDRAGCARRREWVVARGGRVVMNWSVGSHLVAELARIETVVFLQSVDVFSACKAEEVLRIAAIARERARSIKAKQIFSAGDRGRVALLRGARAGTADQRQSRRVKAGPLQTFGGDRAAHRQPARGDRRRGLRYPGTDDRGGRLLRPAGAQHRDRASPVPAPASASAGAVGQ